MSHPRRVILGAGLAAAIVITGSAAFAAPKAERSKAAEQLVKEALSREIYGLGEERQKLLEDAVAEDPDCAAARWHQGLVKYRSKWVRPEEISSLVSSDKRLEAYQRLRDKVLDTVQDQLDLANHCRDKGLADQERAHLTRVLDLSPDNVEARARLGFRNLDGNWVTEKELLNSADKLQADRQSIEKWRPKLDKIREGLQQKSETKRKLAADKLREIRDVSAIPALDMIAADSPEAALVVVETLGNISQNEAALALVRQAVFSPFDDVRLAAAKQLRDRSKDVYVPVMLASLATPVTSRSELFQTTNGRLMYRHAFAREGQDERQLMVLETEYRRVARPGGDGRESLTRAVGNARVAATAREISVMNQNQQTDRLNRRIMDALSVATKNNIPITADQWWKWWNEENEVFVQGDKTTKTTYRQDQIAVRDYVPPPAAAPTRTSPITTPSPRSSDCLAAGTLVWTSAGPIAIETIRPGDLVLAQDPNTGELTYKPVLRTTVRPKGKLIKIQAGNQTIETSGGHLFWVAGEGWTKSRLLEPGMELHGARGTVRVTAVEEGREDETYNLVVADHNSYFVGESLILSHDNTIKQSTNSIVPGLSR